jgi:MFS family permease
MDDQLLAQQRTSRNIRLACVWCAVPMVLLLFGGLIYSGFMVPILPSATAQQVAAQYRTDAAQIRLGLAASFAAVILFLVFGGVIADQTRRIKSAPVVLTYIQIASFGAGSLIFVIPWVCWQTAAFRPEREATQIMLLNDLGWMTFVFSYVAFTAWLIAIGVAILADVAPSPVYPRWLGYFNIVVAVIFVPDNVIPFFKTGPFGWNGIFPYWIPFVSYGIWILMMLRYTVVAINAELHEPTLERATTMTTPASRH